MTIGVTLGLLFEYLESAATAPSARPLCLHASLNHLIVIEASGRKQVRVAGCVSCHLIVNGLSLSLQYLSVLVHARVVHLGGMLESAMLSGGYCSILSLLATEVILFGAK